MGVKYAFTIYNLQINFAELKKIMGDKYAFTIYNLQIIFANLKINVDDTQTLMHLQLRVNNLQNILIHVYFLIYLPMKYQFTKWL